MGLVRDQSSIEVSGVVTAGVGVLLFGIYLLHILLHEAYLQGPLWMFLLGVVFILILTGGLVYSGYWLSKSSLSVEARWQVVLWMFAGVLVASALTFWPIFYQHIVGVSVADPVFIILVSGGIGANSGIVAGVAKARSARRASEVQQARDSLEFLNRMLRHNVLNGLQVIRGNAELLGERSQAELAAERARTIRQQADQIDNVIQNTRILISRLDDNTDYKRVNLSTIVAAELETAESIHSDASIRRHIAPDVFIYADGFVTAVVENLVTNAIIHTDCDHPEVEVTLESRDGTAVLQVADNGPGLTAEEKRMIRDPGEHGNHGLGLYLVGTLVQQYNGHVTFAENDSRGTIVRVEFPVEPSTD